MCVCVRTCSYWLLSEHCLQLGHATGHCFPPLRCCTGEAGDPAREGGYPYLQPHIQHIHSLTHHTLTHAHVPRMYSIRWRWGSLITTLTGSRGSCTSRNRERRGSAEALRHRCYGESTHKLPLILCGAECSMYVRLDYAYGSLVCMKSKNCVNQVYGAFMQDAAKSNDYEFLKSQLQLFSKICKVRMYTYDFGSLLREACAP